MADQEKKQEVGSIVWTDLTVPKAEEVRDFYRQVVGWKSDPVDMGGYQDFNMTASESGSTIAGICHARGSNAELPSQWLIYISVEDLDQSVKKCTEMGGKILGKVRDMGSYGRLCVIQDPSGAVAGLIQPKSS